MISLIFSRSGVSEKGSCLPDCMPTGVGIRYTPDWQPDRSNTIRGTKNQRCKQVQCVMVEGALYILDSDSIAEIKAEAIVTSDR